MFIELTETVVTDNARQNSLETKLTININQIRHFYESVGRCYVVMLPDLMCIAVTESYQQVKDLIVGKPDLPNYVEQTNVRWSETSETPTQK